MAAPSAERPGPSPFEAYALGLLRAAEAMPNLAAVVVGPSAATLSTPFGARYPGRYARLDGPEFVAAVAERAGSGGPVFCAAPTTRLVEDDYRALVDTVVRPLLNAKLVAIPPDRAAHAPSPVGATREDLARMRSLPAVTVVAPADGPSVVTATVALAERSGPAYLRLPPPDAPTITDGAFAVGTAHELRPGSDLAIVGLGPALALALVAAEELGRVGIGVRVLDVASIKPFDEAAILRAARDTGAILVVEEAPIATGIGTLVAAMTAENAPVPVRRVGLPDLWESPRPDGGPEGLGLTFDRVRDEAWELLRLRGRTT